jgi:hypothetical protein
MRVVDSQAVKCGKVYWANLGPTVGTEIRKALPATHCPTRRHECRATQSHRRSTHQHRPAIKL